MVQIVLITNLTTLKWNLSMPHMLIIKLTTAGPACSSYQIHAVQNIKDVI